MFQTSSRATRGLHRASHSVYGRIMLLWSLNPEVKRAAYRNNAEKSCLCVTEIGILC